MVGTTYRAASPDGGTERYASHTVSDLERRSGYTPRRAREQRAYRMVVVGGATGGIGVVTLVLAIAGVVSGTWPVICFIIAALCVFGFLRATGQR
jgi:hypothetical protein